LIGWISVSSEPITAEGGVDHRLATWLFQRVARPPAPPRYDDERFQRRYLDYDLASTQRFLARFGTRLELRGKSVLDIGCGRGALCLEAARRGASRVVGVDLEIASQLHALAADTEGSVELVATDGALEELNGERFDLVVSKDSFEHYPHPESFVFSMIERVRPGGLLAVGFGPLWRSPTGGHIEYMTALPWAHLLFPEPVVMRERRRYRPQETAHTYEEIRGGLNRMTLRRFDAIMASTGLERLYYARNVSDHPMVRAMRLAAALRPLRELFTTNVYALFRRPAADVEV
jgi:SAM-dependent methyltransferase